MSGLEEKTVALLDKFEMLATQYTSELIQEGRKEETIAQRLTN